MKILILSVLLGTALIDLAFAIIFFQLTIQRKQSVYRYFTIFSLLAVVWALGDAIMSFSQSPTIVTIGYLLFLVAPMISTLFIFYFCLLFTNRKPRAIYSLPVFLLVLYAAILFVGNNLYQISFNEQLFNNLYPNKLFYVFYALYFVVYFQVSTLILNKHTKGKNQEKNYQARNLWLGTSLTGTPAIITNVILPIFGITQWVWLGPVFSLIFVAFSLNAIARYKLFDIRATIIRSTSYLFTIGFFSVLYISTTVLVFGNTIFQTRQANTYSTVLFILILLMVSITFHPLVQFFNKVSTRIFYKDSYDAQKVLNKISNVIVNNVSPRKLQKGALDILVEALKPTHATFLLYSAQGDLSRETFMGQEWEIQTPKDLVEALGRTGKRITVYSEIEEGKDILHEVLRQGDISVVAPLITKSKTVGYLILGPKKSGNIYNSQDVQLLNIATNELAVALQNAQRFEEIQNFNVTLQEKVDTATRQLRKTNEKLKQLDETKDDFISMASHQLRTPLTSVKGYVSMVLEGDAGKITPQQRKLLDQSFISSQRMVFLIADLLNVSRLKTGKFIIEAKPTNLSEVVDSEIDQLIETAKGRGLKLAYQKPKSFPLLNLDETKTRQVIMNFVDNAIYYTPSGGTITVSLADRPDSIEFTVVDTGLGVPKHEQPHLFTKFYRAANARKARPDGTGLGLFMAKKVIIAQGGAIIFKSEEGKGSTFGFSFPKRKLLVTDTAKQAAAPQAKPAAKNGTADKKPANKKA